MSDRRLIEQVEKEVGRQWADFEAAHPNLARELEYDWHVGQAMQRLREDPAYRSAMERGTNGAAAAAVLGEVVERVVRAVLRGR